VCHSPDGLTAYIVDVRIAWNLHADGFVGYEETRSLAADGEREKRDSWRAALRRNHRHAAHTIHFVVCSVLILGPEIPSFAIQALLEYRNAWKQKRLHEKRLGNGWVIMSHQPPTVVNRWRRGVGARVVLGLAIVAARYGCFGATFEVEGPDLRGTYNLRILFPPILTHFSIVMRYLGVGDPTSSSNPYGMMYQ
jgi:hypothetical protein